MKLSTLTELNAERAARRPAIVVTEVANGEQRLVRMKDFAADRNSRSQRFYRFINEVPTLLMIGIVILVVVKPF